MEQVATNGHLVYVVDDDTSIARLVSLNLAARGYRVKQFQNGTDAMSSFRGDWPDLIVLDMLMPGPDGLEVTRSIRQFSGVPILVLSVMDEPSAKLAALDLGADDYLTKPFRVEELLARIRALLRRASPRRADSPFSANSYRSGDLLVDLERMRVTSHQRPVQLTPHEWAMLRVLVKYAGRVVSPRGLLQEAWGPDYGDEGDYVRTYIARLRRKLEPDPRHPRYILLERGLGYRLVAAD
jgi:two-component system KDP operon response regulator KdpE